MFYLHSLDYLNGCFVQDDNGENGEEIVNSYSRMKFGSRLDLIEISSRLASKFILKLQDESNDFFQLFRNAALHGQNIVMFAPGYRNVESSSNTLVEIFGQIVNLELARLGLPTIVVMKLTRISSNPANYAKLSAVERKMISDKTRSILPSPSLFKSGTHVLFCDDVRITGSTVERIKEECNRMGALSFNEIYALKLSERVAMDYPEIEDVINTRYISGALDSKLSSLINQVGFRPVQRLLRLVLDSNKKNELMTRVKDTSWISDTALLRLVVSALNNDYLLNDNYKDQVQILLIEAMKRKLITKSFQPTSLNNI